MTRYELVASCITDFFKGSPHSLAELIYWLHYDRKIAIPRILVIAERSFSLPRKVSFGILKIISKEFLEDE